MAASLAPLDLLGHTWPLATLHDGIEHLARRAGLRPASGDPVVVPRSVLEGRLAELERWVPWVGARLGVEAEAVAAPSSGLDALLRGAGPAVLRLDAANHDRFVLLLGSRRGRPRVLCPDLRVRSVSLEALSAAFRAAHEAPLRPGLDRLLAKAGVRASRVGRVRTLLARQQLGDTTVADGWMLRVPPTAGLWRQFADIGLPRRVTLALGLFALTYVLEIAGWNVMGAAALDGQLDLGWLLAWVLLVLSMIPLRLIGTWLDATLALDVGHLVKTRLLMGALQFDIDGVRQQGAGQLLGRVMESQAFESLAVGFGLSAVVAVLELGLAGWVLGLGAAGPLHLLLLVAWLVAAAGLSLRYSSRLGAWTVIRRNLTQGLVERMVGHRTALAQESPERRDQEDDASINDYVHASAGLDRAATPFLAGVPSGWLVLGFAGLAPAFVSGASPARLAISIGGVLLAGRAFSGLAASLASAAGAVVAWRQIGPLFAAASRPPSTTPFVSSQDMAVPTPEEGPGVLIDADGLTYRYHPQGEPVLRGARLTVRHGERLLIEGASGGGKSTLASLLTGLRTPESGVLLLNGLDRFTLGDAWHRFATQAPQFHENHVFSGSLAFNLLMGRRWPATDEDLLDAAALCEELGLGDLLRRMPSGLQQAVGETGWQLSHGERGRLFLARALLQGAPLTVFDESFAALDPESLESCLRCVLARAHTLAVIAHP